MGLTVFDERTPYVQVSHFGDAIPAGHYDLLSGQEPITRVDSILVASDDTIDHVYTFTWGLGTSNDIPFRTLTIPAGRGTLPDTRALNVLDPTVMPDVTLIVGSYQHLGVTIDAPASAGKSVYVTTMGGYV